MFQVVGFRVSSASHQWRFKNAVTLSHNSQSHKSLSQIRNWCQGAPQCHVLMELLKCELHSVIHAKLLFCLEWTCWMCMLLTAIAPNLMVLNCMTNSILRFMDCSPVGSLTPLNRCVLSFPLPLGCVPVSLWLYFPPSLPPLQPEELTLLLIKLRRQQAELNSIREHTVAQLMQLNMDGNNPKVRPPEMLLQALCVSVWCECHL